jgi:HlyD family secretion protein
VLVLLVVGGIGAVIAGNALAEKKVTVYTRPVERKTIVQSVSASGKIKPVVQVEISAYVSAEITKLLVQDGQRVKKGDLLVELDSTRYRATRDGYTAAVTAAQSQATLAKINWEQAKRDYERVENLHKQGLTSKSELEVSRTKVQAQEATVRAAGDDVRRASAQLRLAGDDVAKTVLTSPFDGVIIALNKEAGEMVVGSGFTRDVIMTVADLSAMQLEVEVDENDVPSVKVGQKAKVRIDAFSKQQFEGSVTAIANSARVTGLGTQEETTSFDVTIRLLGALDGLRPGMSGTAEIVTATQQNVLSVPIQCLTMRDPNADPTKPVSMLRTDLLKEVLFAAHDGRAAMVPVKTGISSDFDIEVQGAVEAGIELICGPFKILNKQLKPGDLLDVKDEAAVGAEQDDP